jgi:hypothetical protein
VNDLDNTPDNAGSGPPDDDQGQANDSKGQDAKPETGGKTPPEENGHPPKGRKGKPKQPKKGKAEHLADALRKFQVTLTYKLIPFGEIACTRNRTEDPDSFEALVANLLATKLILQPLVVRWDDGEKKYRVLAGRRRFFASLEARAKHEAKQIELAAQGKPKEGPIFTELPCLALEGPMNKGQEVVVSIIENAYRLDEEPAEKALHLKEAYEEGLTYEDLMNCYGIGSKGTISELLWAAENLTPEELQSCRRQEVTVNNVPRTKPGKSLFKLVREKKPKKGGDEPPESPTGEQPKPPSGEKPPAGPREEQPKEGPRTRAVTKGFHSLRSQKLGLSLAFESGARRKEPTIPEVLSVLEKWIEELKQLL